MTSKECPTLNVEKSDLCLPFEFCQGSHSWTQHFLVILDSLRDFKLKDVCPQTNPVGSDKMSLTVSIVGITASMS